MLAHAAALDVVGVRHLVAGAIDEAVRDDLVERPRRGQELEEARLARRDHGGEALEPREKLAPALDDADVVEGRVPARLERACERERALEVRERRPRVAVVRTEAREVDVAEIE